MSIRWVVDVDHPAGYPVEMTTEEQAAFDAEQTAAVPRTAADTLSAANHETIHGKLKTALTDIQAGVDAIEAGTRFQGLTAPERTFLKRLARVELGLIRLELRALESSD